MVHVANCVVVAWRHIIWSQQQNLGLLYQEEIKLSMICGSVNGWYSDKKISIYHVYHHILVKSLTVGIGCSARQPEKQVHQTCTAAVKAIRITDSVA